MRLAVRWIFLLGVDLTFLGLGAVDMAPFVEMDRFTFFFSTTPIDPTLMLFVGFGFLIAGMLYIFIAISLFRPQLGAIMAAIILVALNVVFVVFLSILALPAVLIRGPFIFVFTGPLCVAALVRVILHLVMSFDSIHAQTSSGFASKGRNTRLYARLAPNIVAGLLAVFLTWFIWQRYKSR